MPFFSPLGCHELDITVPLGTPLLGSQVEWQAGCASSAAKGDLEEKENSQFSVLLVAWLHAVTLIFLTTTVYLLSQWGEKGMVSCDPFAPVLTLKQTVR